MQPTLRKMQPMDIHSNPHFAMSALSVRIRFPHALLVALLLGTGAVHASGAQVLPPERPPNLLQAREGEILPGASEARSTQPDPTERKPGGAAPRVVKPYGSGYEARGLSPTRDNAPGTDDAQRDVTLDAGAVGLPGTTMRPGVRASGSGNRGGGAGGRGRR